MSNDPREHAPVDEQDIQDAIDHVHHGLHAPKGHGLAAAPATTVPRQAIEAAVRAAVVDKSGNPVGKANLAAIIQAVLAALAAVAPFFKGENPAPTT